MIEEEVVQGVDSPDGLDPPTGLPDGLEPEALGSPVIGTGTPDGIAPGWLEPPGTVTVGEATTLGLEPPVTVTIGGTSVGC